MRPILPELDVRDNLRAAIFSPRLHGGGAERAARDIFQGLPSLGVSTEMFVAKRSSHDPSNVASVRYAGEKYLKALRLVMDEADAWYPGSRTTLARLNTASFAISHFHNIHSGWMAVSAVQSLCCRMPVIWSLHDEWSVSLGYPYNLENALGFESVSDWLGNSSWKYNAGHTKGTRMRQRLRRLMPTPTAVITPSTYLGKLAAAAEHFGRSCIYTIPYGLSMLERDEVCLPRADARRRLGLPLDKSIVLLIAAHFNSPYKGMWLAEKMCDQLNNAEFHLVVVGGQSEDFARRVGLPCSCLGQLHSDQDLATVYRASDVTLIPSVADNFPYVGLESMACETPVVCFDVGGLSEMVGKQERGYAAARFDTGDLARGVTLFCQDPAWRQRVGRAGQEWVRERCNMSTYLQRIERVYRATIEDFRAGRHSSDFSHPPVDA
jgi:glycosyltransferase involved in cell wall biosynthesis